MYFIRVIISFITLQHSHVLRYILLKLYGRSGQYCWYVSLNYFLKVLWDFIYQFIYHFLDSSVCWIYIYIVVIVFHFWNGYYQSYGSIRVSKNVFMRDNRNIQLTSSFHFNFFLICTYINDYLYHIGEWHNKHHELSITHFGEMLTVWDYICGTHTGNWSKAKYESQKFECNNQNS